MRMTDESGELGGSVLGFFEEGFEAPGGSGEGVGLNESGHERDSIHRRAAENAEKTKS
jgi:hypothetical protein